MLTKLLVLNLLFSGLSTFAQTSLITPDSIEQELFKFRQNPKTYMWKLPEKTIPQGAILPLLPQNKKLRSYIEIKDKVRKKICQDGTCLEHYGHEKASIDTNPARLVDNPREMLLNLKKMNEKGLEKAKLEVGPWSDDYWPIYKGILGARYDYSLTDFPNSRDWKKNKDYINQNPARTIFYTGNQEMINALSPSEKYDILVGDLDFHLTQAMWEEGRSYYEEHGEVETWMGICHGWAPASFMMSRPAKFIDLKAPNYDQAIRFYPADIKALGTLLWANGKSSSRFLGRRCNTKKPETDENGRIIDSLCFDSNPGAWHIALINQIAINKRSMVIDATYDYEVWNQPVYAYEIRYFNPLTDQVVDDLDEALVSKKEFEKKDLFKKYRGDYEYIVGIGLELTYVSESRPYPRLHDSFQYDSLVRVRYLYDLELDRQGKILGGEWYTNNHPDFLWLPPLGEKAQSPIDPYLSRQGSWNPEKESIPSSWRNLILQGYRYLPHTQRVPSGQVVYSLFESTAN